jgi:hypothetical protein
MAATLLGTSGLSFGITAESGGLVQSFSETRNIQRAEARNGSGEVVGLSLYNPTKSYSYTFLTTASMSTAAGAVLSSIANASDVTGKVVVDSVSISKTADGYQTASINATQFPNVS